MHERHIEYGLLFALIALIGFMVWHIFAPFFGMLALAATIVIITQPLHDILLSTLHNRFFAALSATIAAYAIILVPSLLIGYLLVNEAAALYGILTTHGPLTFDTAPLENLVRTVLPSFTLNTESILREAALLITRSARPIVTGTASFGGMLVLSMIVSFYFFCDGRRFTRYLSRISPFSEKDDQVLIRSVVSAVRGVILGVLIISLLQGILTTIGFALFGFQRAILFGVFAAFAAFLPGVGPGLAVFTPTVIYLLLTGQYSTALGVGIWGFGLVVALDHILGPLFMRKNGATLHPVLILLSALGGIAYFGLIGFVLGPVTVNLFLVLLELYSTHLAPKNRNVAPNTHP